MSSELRIALIVSLYAVAAVLALKGRAGWGWFLFAAIVFTPSISSA